VLKQAGRVDLGFLEEVNGLIAVTSTFRRKVVHYRRVILLRTRMLLLLSAAILIALVVGGCSNGTGSRSDVDPTASTPAEAQSTPTVNDHYPEVLDAQLTAESEDTYNIAVTISSPYDSPGQYADGWRVLTPASEELGSHQLTHDHASEQPFTRTQYGLRIPASVSEVVVEGRDTQNGYGGERVTIQVPTPDDSQSGTAQSNAVTGQEIRNVK
jgi:hypothetical protein